jgi:3-methyladenine DNA glycosylase/8-oxoguanine DNA glycosylase
MTINTHRLTAFVEHLFERTAQRQPINELAQQLRLDPACRGLNRPYDLAELMVRTIAP